MENPRKYGQPPFNIVLVHGGPGAPGEMKPVAIELSKTHSVLEPIQTANSVDGQVAELKSFIETQAESPVYLVGYSWGAWLSFILAAQHPDLVKKLILISSGPFEAKYAEQILPTRISRLSLDEQVRVKNILTNLQSGKTEDTSELGSLMDKADSFDPLPKSDEGLGFQANIYNSVWPQADELRRSGRLLDYAKNITCPVVAIHGDHDPHPTAGVEEPLSKSISDFKFIKLNNCGHTPWNEKQAKEKFYEILQSELF